ncbi:melanopsin-A-like [Mya arenaria]|uniref:melanopsin-A-like n=1 Tax=Mya arenaria TaxID=6604 RepID=UPI0022E912AA|nr:melanopsin-A-like [Mya arenaria]
MNKSSEADYADSIYIFYGTYIGVIFILGLFQNSVTLYVFIRDKRLHKFHNYFIVALAIADVGMCLCGHWMVVVSALYHRWVFARQGCVIYGFSTTFFGLSQISLLASIAFDRYLIIVRPHGLRFTTKTACILVAVCYIYGCVWAMFPAIGWSSYQLEGLLVRCAINWQSKTPFDLSFSLSVMVLGWMLPLFVIIFSYGGLFNRLRIDKRRQLLKRHRNKSKRHKNEGRMAITVLLMIGAFFISWTPYSVATLVAAFGPKDKVPTFLTVLPAIFAKSSIIWNPIIYVARHSLFRKSLSEHIPCLFCFGAKKSLCANRTNERHSDLTTNRREDISGNRISMNMARVKETFV